MLDNELVFERIEQDEIIRELGQGHVRLTESFSDLGILRPFSNEFILKDLTQTLKELKESGHGDDIFNKRLSLLERQIDGLLQRDLMISRIVDGKDKTSSYYYETLSGKEKEIIKF